MRRDRGSQAQTGETINLIMYISSLIVYPYMADQRQGKPRELLRHREPRVHGRGSRRGPTYGCHTHIHRTNYLIHCTHNSRERGLGKENFPQCNPFASVMMHNPGYMGPPASVEARTAQCHGERNKEESGIVGEGAVKAITYV